MSQLATQLSWNHYVELLPSKDLSEILVIGLIIYVVVELKITEFKVEYISQVQKHMNYIDKKIEKITHI